MAYTDLGSQRIEEVKKKVEDALAFYKRLQTLSVPELIIEVGDDVDTVTEFLVPKMDSKTLALWRTRAEKIESINDALGDYEAGVVGVLSISSESVWFHEIHKLLKKFEWLLGHIGEILILLAATLGYVDGKYKDTFFDKVAEALDATLQGDYKKAKDKVKDLSNEALEMLEVLVTSVVLGLLAQILESTILALGSGVYATNIVPVLKQKATTELALQDSAFPQRPGRVRRKKKTRAGGGGGGKPSGPKPGGPAPPKGTHRNKRKP